jgi:poly(3-hydroxybutyrate) depolymerase
MSYILYVPANFKANSSALVMALHPRNTEGAKMEALTQLNAKADAVGFAVLYPSAPGYRQWGWLFKDNSDVPALRAMISTVQATLHADPKRIYALGYSDGAEMAHRVGVEMGDVVAAIAPVSGALYEGVAPLVLPTAVSPVSVLIVHADLPSNISFYVCGYALALGAIPSQDTVFNYWAGPSTNACSTFDTTQSICDGGVPLLSAKKATGCKESAEVQFYQLQGPYATHGWYNTAGRWSVPLDGSMPVSPYNAQFNATTGLTTNDVIWNFFAAHPKP